MNNKELELQEYIKKHRNIIENSIFPKIKELFEGTRQEKQINFILDRTFLEPLYNFKSEDEVLSHYCITKKEVIKDSILYGSHDIIESNDLDYLIEQFEPFSHHNKMKILDDKVVFTEIIDALAYIKNMQNLFSKLPKHDSNHLGTKHRSSSYKDLLKTQLNHLKDRINNPFFPVINESEIYKTKLQIKFIETSLDKRHQDLPEYFNLIKNQYGLNQKLFAFEEREIEIYNQLLSFFNGLKVSKYELINSVMILLSIKLNIPPSSNDTNVIKKFAESIHNLTYFLFKNEINILNESNKKRNITFNEKSFQKQITIKTYIYDVPIFSYIYKNTNDAFTSQIVLGINAILGFKTIFDKDNLPNEDDITPRQVLKNFYKSMQEFGLTKQELRILITILFMSN